MAAKILSIAFQLNNTTGNQDITIAGIGGETIKAARIIAACTTSQNANNDHLFMSHGYTDGTNQRYVYLSHRDNVSPPRSYRGYDNDAIIFLHSITSGIYAKASFVSFITNGIRINVTTAPSSKIWCLLQLFAGNDISAYVTAFNPSTSINGTVTITPGFQSDIIYFAAADSPETNDSGWAWISNSEGIAVRNSNQACMHHSMNDNASPSQVDGSTINNRVARLGSSSLELTSITSTQFIVTTRDATISSGRFVICLAIKIANGEASLQFIDSPTSTGNISYTNAGFEPTIVEIVGSQAQAYNTFYTDGRSGAWFYYLKDSNTENTIVGGAQDNVSTSNSFVRQGTNRLIHVDHAQTTRHQATFVSFISNGVTINFSTTDSSARKWFILYIKEPSGTNLPIFYMHRITQKMS